MAGKIVPAVKLTGTGVEPALLGTLDFVDLSLLTAAAPLTLTAGTVTTGTLTLNTGGTATVNLDGGTLTATTITPSVAGTKTINFNGGGQASAPSGSLEEFLTER